MMDKFIAIYGILAMLCIAVLATIDHYHAEWLAGNKRVEVLRQSTWVQPEIPEFYVLDDWHNVAFRGCLKTDF